MHFINIFLCCFLSFFIIISNKLPIKYAIAPIDKDILLPLYVPSNNAQLPPILVNTGPGRVFGLATSSNAYKNTASFTILKLLE